MWRFRTHKPQDADPEADAALISKLQAFSVSPDPLRASQGRARLLSEVARSRHASPQPSHRTTALDLLLGRKRLALAAFAVITLGAAGAVSASGGVSDSAGNVAAVLDALNITDRTPDQADSHIEDAGGGGGTNSPDGNANDNADEGAGNADDGINNSNASEEGIDNADDNADEGAGNADDGAANGDVDHPADPPLGPDADLPDEADDHASEGAGNASDNVPDDVGPPVP